MELEKQEERAKMEMIEMGFGGMEKTKSGVKSIRSNRQRGVESCQAGRACVLVDGVSDILTNECMHFHAIVAALTLTLLHVRTTLDPDSLLLLLLCPRV